MLFHKKRGRDCNQVAMKRRGHCTTTFNVHIRVSAHTETHNHRRFKFISHTEQGRRVADKQETVDHFKEQQEGNRIPETTTSQADNKRQRQDSLANNWRLMASQTAISQCN